MFIDSRKLPYGEVIHTEVCIVGAGPAGIALAHEFIGQSFRVCLLESGDLIYNAEAATLGEGETDGDPFPPLVPMRPRQFGGQATQWYIEYTKNRFGLRHVPLDKIDFEKRDWVPYSGWPFTKEHLDPFYERAHTFCKLGPYTYEAKDWEKAHSPRVQFKNDRVTTDMFQFGPSDIFTHEYRKQINRSPNITTYLNAHVLEIESDESAKTARAVHVGCLSGNRFRVEAKVIILATGGTENPRILLLSNKVQNTGLGNQNDLVGRFYMDHPLVRCGMLVPQNRKVFNTMALYDLREENGVSVMGKFRLSEETLRREKLFSMTALLYPQGDTPAKTPTRSQAMISAKTLLTSILHGKLPERTLHHLKQTITGIDDLAVDIYKFKINRSLLPADLARGGWSHHKDNEKRFTQFEVLSQTEQTPDPNNRVTLGNKRDLLGCPMMKLTDRWSELDISSVKRTQQIFAQEFASAGLGELRVDSEGDRPVASLSTHHNMGTTRMHNDPKQGVVDANCQVHGIANLYMAGSSVFPTGGYANPTLTIIALSIRLADHVKATLNGKQYLKRESSLIDA